MYPLTNDAPIVYSIGNGNQNKDIHMSKDNKTEWLSTKEASVIMGVAQDTVAELCRNNKVTCMKIGTSWAVSRADAENFERSNRGRKPSNN